MREFKPGSLPHIEKRVLVILTRYWLWDLGGNSWYDFGKLAEQINRPKELTRQAVHSLADKGYLEHGVRVDHDMQPHGSGYFYTPQFHFWLRDQRYKKHGELEY